MCADEPGPAQPEPRLREPGPQPDELHAVAPRPVTCGGWSATSRRPVFISGAFQDEQTGPQFTQMLDEFDEAAAFRANLWNGRHPDGYAPVNLNDVFEFLELYVAERVPVMNPVVRAALPAVLADQFGLADTAIEPDRFTELRRRRRGGPGRLRGRARGARGVRERPRRQRGRRARRDVRARSRLVAGRRRRAGDVLPGRRRDPDHRRARPGRRGGGRRLPLRPRRRGGHPLRRHRRLPAARPRVDDRLDAVRPRGGGRRT